MVVVAMVWLAIIGALVAFGVAVRNRSGPTWLSYGFWACSLAAAVLLVFYLAGAWRPGFLPVYAP